MDSMIRLLAWVAVALAAAAWHFALARRARPRLVRVCYGAGFLVYSAHVAAAFHFIHEWDHAAAVVETAERARAAIGYAPASAIYVNHFFAAAWLLGVAAPSRFGPLPWNAAAPLARAVHAFMAFIAANGAVVFAFQPVLRGLSAVGGLWLLARYAATFRAPEDERPFSLNPQPNAGAIERAHHHERGRQE